MIISELKLNKKGNPDLRQKCRVKCDKCRIEFERRYDVLKSSRKKFQLDLCRKCSWHETERPPSIFIELNKSNKGKTYEEMYGKEKATQLKKIKSEQNSGEKNPNYQNKSNGANGFIRYSKSCIGKTYEEILGKEKALETKNKIKSKVSGKNNGMYGRPSPTGSGNGWSGWYRGIYFRSLLELSYLKYLMDNNIKFENGEKSEYKITYCINNENKNYFPDFYLIDTNEIIEIKPKKLVNSYINKEKFKSGKMQYGDKFKVLTEQDIVKLDFKSIYVKGELKFLPRYEEKFENMIKERRN